MSGVCQVSIVFAATSHADIVLTPEQSCNMRVRGSMSVKNACDRRSASAPLYRMDDGEGLFRRRIAMLIRVMTAALAVIAVHPTLAQVEDWERLRQVSPKTSVSIRTTEGK